MPQLAFLGAMRRFNPWMGCTKVSPACVNCYAERDMDHRYGKVKWGPTGTRVRTSEGNWRKPLSWNRKAAAEGVRPRVFCASLADVFEDKPELKPYRSDLCVLIEKCRNLDWLLLTKRPGNITRAIADATGRHAWAWLADCRHVWCGTSVENRDYYDRIAELQEVPAAVRFLSVEPMLGPCDDIPLEGIHWVICGGESGPNARPLNPHWVRGLRDRCEAEGVAFHFKQWGEWIPGEVESPNWRDGYVSPDGEWCMYDGEPEPGAAVMTRVGKKAAGRLLDGRTHDAFPSPAPSEETRT